MREAGRKIMRRNIYRCSSIFHAAGLPSAFNFNDERSPNESKVDSAFLRKYISNVAAAGDKDSSLMENQVDELMKKTVSPLLKRSGSEIKEKIHSMSNSVKYI